MKTRIIHTKVWKDSYVSNLNKNEKLLFIYLLTNENINMCGVYEINDKEIQTWLDIPIKEVNQIKDKFLKDKKFYFFNGWVKVLNHEKYNSYGKGEKQEASLKRELSLIPVSVSTYFDSLDTSIDTSMHTDGILDINHKSEIIIHKSETINHKSEYRNISDLTQNEIINIANEYNLPVGLVENSLDSLKNYCLAKGKTYKDYRAALRNFVKSDALKYRKESGYVAPRAIQL